MAHVPMSEQPAEIILPPEVTSERTPKVTFAAV